MKKKTKKCKHLSRFLMFGGDKVVFNNKGLTTYTIPQKDTVCVHCGKNFKNIKPKSK